MAFFDKWFRAGGCARSNYPFLTLKERDNETGLDYFLARYYSSTQGRFTSPDEFTGGPDELFHFAEDASENPTFYAEVDNPQSLNKYQYTYNNPLNMVDPDGLCPPCFGPSVSGVLDSIELITNFCRALDKLQLKISVAGSVPGAGEVADLVNAGISALRGNKAEAALDLAGALGPVGSGVAVGNRIRKLGKLTGVGGEIGETVGDLRRAGKKDAHHTIQDAAVKDLPRYKTNAAPGVELPGPSNKAGTPHNAATAVQRQRGGGTYASERRIGYKSLRRAGLSRAEARREIQRADNFFGGIGVTSTTPTRIPGNRRRQ